MGGFAVQAAKGEKGRQAMKRFTWLVWGVMLLSVPAILLVNTGRVRYDAGVPVASSAPTIREIGEAAKETGSAENLIKPLALMAASGLVALAGGLVWIFGLGIGIAKSGGYIEKARPARWNVDVPAAGRRTWDQDLQDYV